MQENPVYTAKETLGSSTLITHSINGHFFPSPTFKCMKKNQCSLLIKARNGKESFICKKRRADEKRRLKDVRDVSELY